jgi:hypothetical protein
MNEWEGDLLSRMDVKGQGIEVSGVHVNSRESCRRDVPFLEPWDR